MDNANLARNVAKWIVISIVDVKTTQLTADTIADHTHFEKDDLFVKLASGAVGMVVASTVKPVTDKMVDRTADFAVAQWNKRKPKKNPEKTEN